MTYAPMTEADIAKLLEDHTTLRQEHTELRRQYANLLDRHVRDCNRAPEPEMPTAR